MRLKIPILAVLTLLTVLLSSGPIYTPIARAIPGPSGGVLDPSNVFAPYGPRSGKLQYNFYADEFVEFTQFELGQLDVADWNVPRAKWAGYDANPDIVLTQAQGEFGMFEVDFNHEGPAWTAWGCDFTNGNSACGSEIRKAIAHLIDRPQWVITGILGGAAQALADPSPPAKVPAGSTLATQQGWDPTHATINAFNIATDLSGFATAGSADMCAARDHMVAAGIGFVDANNNCVIDNPPSTPVRFMIRSDSAPRRQAGIGIMNALNVLMGTDVVAETLGDIVQLGDIVFVARPADDWEAYTGGWFLGGAFPDHFRALYGSLFASDFCGGRRSNRPLNYGFVCVSAFDAHADAAAQTDNLAVFGTEILAAMDEFGKKALTVPLYSAGSRFAALRDVAGKVDAKGVGYPNFYTLLNGRADASYTPSNSMFTFGGSAGPDTMRWGQKQGTTKLNIFHATTLWDFNVLGTIYDGLVATSPIEPEKVIAWMANKYTICIVPDLGCPVGGARAAGDTSITFDLRAGLQFHDGVPVTAEDVKFSILNYRDAPADNLLGAVELVKDVVVHGTLKVEIIWAGRSLTHITNSGVSIIPKHLWDTNNDGQVDADKFDPAFDPIAAGILTGSGPFVCRSVFAADLDAVGTGCARNADGSRGGQTIAPGGSMLLAKFDLADASHPLRQYMRSYNPAWPAGGSQSGQFQEISYADQDNNAKVDVVDVSSVAACFGKSAPDAACPAATYAYWDRLGLANDITVEAVVVAQHIDDTLTDPFTWDPSVIVNIVPFTP